MAQCKDMLDPCFEEQNWFVDCWMPANPAEGNVLITLTWGFLGVLVKGLSECQCFPDCEGKQCGDDGCGGECPGCKPWEYCLDGSCEPDPTVLCKDGECELKDYYIGPGKWGKVDCGSCPVGLGCVDNKCVAEDCINPCKDKECGPDGCGGSCGQCMGPQDSCIDGACECQPACESGQCGMSDGCGGTCGCMVNLNDCVGDVCAPLESCEDGVCIPIPEAICKLNKTDCGLVGFPGTAGNTVVACGDNGVCEFGDCVSGKCVCAADCNGKDCGPDGCGGSCGECPEDNVCSNWKCQLPGCNGKDCGDDGVGGSCGECEEGSHCGEDGICYYDDCMDENDQEFPWKNECDGNTLKKCHKGEVIEQNCDAFGPGYECGLGDSGKYACRPGPCAGIPPEGKCDGDNYIFCSNNHKEIKPCEAWEKACGLIPDKDSHGCVDPECVDMPEGGKCQGAFLLKCKGGEFEYEQCAEGMTCGIDAGDFAACACAPDCEGKQCGDDGCGGSCGECVWGQVCYKNQCCFPACTTKECGDDGCGGSCPPCSIGETCVDDECVCVPDCEGKECGGDGCGGVCGSCADADMCIEGLCLFCGTNQAQYEALLDNPKVAQVLQLTELQRAVLVQALADLECKNTKHWDNLQSLLVTQLSSDEMELVWLRRIAVSFYNQIGSDFDWQFGWKIEDLDEEQLQCLLGLHAGVEITPDLVKQLVSPALIETPDYLGCDFLYGGHLDLPDPADPQGEAEPYWRPAGAIWACDPASVNNIAMKIRQWCLERPDWYSPYSSYDAIRSIIDYMRHEMDWEELDLKPWVAIEGHPKEGAPNACWNIEDVDANGVGGCHHASAFIRYVMSCMNVPVLTGRSSQVPGLKDPDDPESYHVTFLAMTDLGKVTMVGCSDNIFSYPFDHCPAEHSLTDMAKYKELSDLRETPGTGEFDYRWHTTSDIYKDFLFYVDTNDFWTEQLFVHFFLEYSIFYMYGPEESNPFGEPPNPKSHVYQGLNVLTKPKSDGSEVDKTLKEELWSEILEVFTKFCSPDIYLETAAQMQLDMLGLEDETDPAKAQELQLYIDKALLVLDAVGCADGLVCTWLDGYSACS